MVNVMNHTYDLIYPMLELPMDKQGESIQNALLTYSQKLILFNLIIPLMSFLITRSSTLHAPQIILS